MAGIWWELPAQLPYGSALIAPQHMRDVLLGLLLRCLAAATLMLRSLCSQQWGLARLAQNKTKIPARAAIGILSESSPGRTPLKRATYIYIEVCGLKLQWQLCAACIFHFFKGFINCKIGKPNNCVICTWLFNTLLGYFLVYENVSTWESVSSRSQQEECSANII